MRPLNAVKCISGTYIGCCGEVYVCLLGSNPLVVTVPSTTTAGTSLIHSRRSPLPNHQGQCDYDILAQFPDFHFADRNSVTLLTFLNFTGLGSFHGLLEAWDDLFHFHCLSPNPCFFPPQEVDPSTLLPLPLSQAIGTILLFEMYHGHIPYSRRDRKKMHFNANR